MRDLDHGTAVGIDGAPIVQARRAVTIPVLEGRRIPGVPTDARGFVPVDEHGAVIGLPDVWAVGDATTFPLKQGGLAAQQADAAADGDRRGSRGVRRSDDAPPGHASEAVHRRAPSASRRGDERGRREGRDDLPRADADAARHEGAGVSLAVPTQFVIAGAGVAGLETLLARACARRVTGDDHRPGAGPERSPSGRRRRHAVRTRQPAAARLRAIVAASGAHLVHGHARRHRRRRAVRGHP